MNKLQISGISIVSGAPALDVILTVGSVFAPSIKAGAIPFPQNQCPWAVIPLPLSAGNVISNITVSYYVSGNASCITDIFLGTLQPAGSLYVNYAYQAMLNANTLQTVSIPVNPGVTVSSSLGLWFEFAFGNTTDSITVTTVEIDYQ